MTAGRGRDAPRERFAMNTAESIRKFGFKRWYERTLIESHAYLVTCFLGMVTAFAGLQLAAEHGGIAQSLLGYVASAFGVVLAVIGLRRYTRLMALAWDLGERATCPQCQAYASFQVTSAGAADADDTSPRDWLGVRCRKCGNEWKM
jgi:hypothetical protein